MDLKQLRYFTAVAQLQNLSRAAELIQVSQPTLSKQIAKLEEEIGVPLFDRNGKNIQLNAAGMLFQEYATKILKESKNIKEDLRIASHSEGVAIRIGAAALPDSFPEYMMRFHELHPEIEFVVTSHIEEEENLDINDYDVLICPDEYRFQRVSGHPFYTERYLFAVPSESEDFKEKAFTTALLDRKPLIFIRRHKELPDYTFRVCSALAMDTARFFYTDSRETQHRMIASGLGAGFVPESEARSFRLDPKIRLLPVLNKRFYRPMKLCFLREKHLSEQAKLFREFLMEYYGLKDALPSVQNRHYVL